MTPRRTDYETDRPPFAIAEGWDRLVHLTRARDRLRSMGATDGYIWTASGTTGIGSFAPAAQQTNSSIVRQAQLTYASNVLWTAMGSAGSINTNALHIYGDVFISSNLWVTGNISSPSFSAGSAYFNNITVTNTAPFTNIAMSAVTIAQGTNIIVITNGTPGNTTYTIHGTSTGGGTPGGTSGAIQFAEGTALAGTNGLTFDRTNNWISSSVSNRLSLGSPTSSISNLFANQVTALSTGATNQFGQTVFNNGIEFAPFSAAVMTNIFCTSTNLDFAATTVGSVQDIPVYLPGAADGDAITVTPAISASTNYAGIFGGFGSNNYVYVRFVPTGTSQNPGSGNFRVKAEKYR